MSNTSTFDSTYQVKLAQIAALQGDTTKKYDSVYQTELEILKKLEEGGLGAQIDDTEVSTGKVWSSSKTNAEIQAVNESIIINEGDVMDTSLFNLLAYLPQNDFAKKVFVKSADNHGVFRVATFTYGTLVWFDQYDGTIKIKYNTNFPVPVGQTISFTSINMPKINDDNNTSTGTVWSSSKAQSYASSVGFHYMYVQSLPATGQPRTIYFVPTGETPVQGQPNDVCNEYMYFSTPDSSFAYWEQIGTRRVDLSQYYTKTETDTALSAKQATLVSGTNIKTINNNSILGSGNIDIQGGGGAGVVELTQAEYDALAVKDPSIIYNITDATAYVMEDYFTKVAADASFGSLDTKYNPYNTTTPVTGGYYLPLWNARGQITGTGNYLYQRSFSINGNAQTIFGTGSGSLTGVYAATTAGTAGQVLQSTGSGAPQWVDFRSDATYYISEADCSAGTYSTDIASFYADCITNQKVGPMQLVNNTSHNIGTPGDTSVSTVLNTDAKFVVRNGSTAQFKYGDSFITIDANGNISDPDATGVISPEPNITVFGYHTFKNADTIDVTAGDVYLITVSVQASQSYYYPSSTRMFSGNVELWFFTTENGATWNNLHILITNNAVTADSTSGTFGN